MTDSSATDPTTKDTDSTAGAGPCAATPRTELERQIMSACEPKNEREWWAQHEIERMREVLEEVREFLIDDIDGGEEYQGRDSRLSYMARRCESVLPRKIRLAPAVKGDNRHDS